MQAVVDFLNVFDTEASKTSVTLSLFLIFLGLLYCIQSTPSQSSRDVASAIQSQYLSLATYSCFSRYYLGRTPVVVVADPDMLRQVMVKDFNSFPNRKLFVFAKKPVSDCLLLLRNEQWKRVRSVLSPSLSAAKMKKVPLELKATRTLGPKNGVFVKIRRRHQGGGLLNSPSDD